MNIKDIFVPYGPSPSKLQMDWYHRRTAFFHFTVNTFTGKEWGDGTESPAIFNPTELDCRQWISTVKKAGFSTAVLTAKHHDGFCLWQSKYTEHCMKNSPYKDGKGDIVREFVEACREFDVKPGLYLSPWDRNHPEWGTPAYSEYYADQLTELMTEYGEIYDMFWDLAGSDRAKYEWEKWAEIIHKYQPECSIYGLGDAVKLLDTRWVGNESGIAGIDCFATISEKAVAEMDMDELNSGKIDGELFLPAVADVSIRPGWFYHKEQDDLVKTAEDLVNLWFTSEGRNAGIMLNFPITDKGLVHEIDAKNAIDCEEYLKEIFAENLLKNSKVYSENTISDEYKPENLLDENENTYFVADGKEAVITFELPKETEFNCIKLAEVIELGHRVRGYAIEYFKDGKWETLMERKCIGFCRSEYFDAVKTDKVRIRIINSAEISVLRYFGVYKAPDKFINYVPKKREKISLSKMSTTKTTRCDDGIEVDFGGIFPFNVIVFNGDDINEFEILAFNGTSYNSIYSGKSNTGFEVCWFPMVEGSYKVKFVIKDREVKENIDDYRLEVLCE